MELFSFKSVSFSYENVLVADDINFEVNEGDFLSIVGENGSGKTTLINGLLNLKQTLSGSIQVNIERTDIGFLPQQKNVKKDFPAGVFEVVLSGCLNKSKMKLFYNKADRETANANMEKLGILGLKNKSYAEISGGQQQRVLLARALCSSSKLLVLDEPVSALDPLITEEFYKVIASLNKEDNMAIVMVSHDVKTALDYSTHILHMDKKQLFFGSKCDCVKSDIYSKYMGGNI